MYLQYGFLYLIQTRAKFAVLYSREIGISKTNHLIVWLVGKTKSYRWHTYLSIEENGASIGSPTPGAVMRQRGTGGTLYLSIEEKGASIGSPTPGTVMWQREVQVAHFT